MVMQPALSLFWMVTGFALVIGTVMMVVGLVRAPEGYENQDGFQYADEGDGQAANQVAHSSHPNLA